ncbi:hypothetical protein niasHT_034659 [Heterodera trifolii]|uniref:Uncharacterized protein n=1 Tax=Heterodera trifolii TaxID=157864 RepID=A0ABD2IRJ5_9BILA
MENHCQFRKFKCHAKSSRIDISYIDRNVIAFLNRFRPLFGTCPFSLYMETTSRDRTLELILRNIWPMIGQKISDMHLSVKCFHCLRKFVPSILTDCSSLRVLAFNIDDVFAEFPADDSAMASDGQALAKWLFTPRPDDVPKELKCWLKKDDGTSRVEAFKTAFADALSPVNFIVFIWVVYWSFGSSVEPFELTNELTREHLVLKRVDFCGRFLLVRCPIARDESKWTKWEKEALDWQISDQLQQINIQVYREDQLGDGLFDETPGPSDQQQK